MAAACAAAAPPAPRSTASASSADNVDNFDSIQTSDAPWHDSCHGKMQVIENLGRGRNPWHDSCHGLAITESHMVPRNRPRVGSKKPVSNCPVRSSDYFLIV